MGALRRPAWSGRPTRVAAASLVAVGLSAVASMAGARELEVYENDARLSRPGSFTATIRTPGPDDICDYRAARPSEHACAGIDVAARQKELSESVRGGPGFEWLADLDVVAEGGPIAVSVLRFDVDTRKKIDRSVIEENLRVMMDGLKQTFGEAATFGQPTFAETPNPACTIDMESRRGEATAFVRAHLVFGEGAAYGLLFAGPRAARQTTIGIADATIGTIRVEAPTPRDPGARWYFWFLIGGPVAFFAWLRRGGRGEQAVSAYAPEDPPDLPGARDARHKRRRARRAEQAAQSEETNDEG